MEKELKLLEKEIRRRVVAEDKFLSSLALHAVEAGGKRIRPKLALLAFKAVGGTDVSELIPLAAAYELVHTATLIHDDVSDSSPLRRGRATLNKLYGDAISVVVGDFLFVKGYESCARYGEKIVEITADACTDLAEGQLLELINLRNLEMEEPTYFEIIKKKTASPFSAGARAGALLGGGSATQINALANYGLNLGIAFQITDDILDCTGDENVIGKPVGMDIRRGNLTIISIHALEHASRKDAEKLKNILQGKSKRIKDAIKIMEKSGSIDYARSKANYFASEAKKCLRVRLLRRSELTSLVDKVVHRCR